MEIDRINKYCHVSAYIAYDNCSPVYKQTFKFEISFHLRFSITSNKHQTTGITDCAYQL